MSKNTDFPPLDWDREEKARLQARIAELTRLLKLQMTKDEAWEELIEASWAVYQAIHYDHNTVGDLYEKGLPNRLGNAIAAAKDAAACVAEAVPADPAERTLGALEMLAD